MVKIAVLASFNMDLVMRADRRPDAGETLQGEFAMHLGGKGFNQAVAARRLGADVAVAGRVGDDEFGRMFLEALDREGIDRRGVVVDREAGTGVASIIVEPDGTNTIIQAPRANRRIRPDDIVRAPELLRDAAFALTQLETSDTAATAFARAARDAGAVTMLNAAPAAAITSELRTLSDVVVANEIEAVAIGAGLARIADPPSAAKTLLTHGHHVVAITLGGQGAIAVDGSGAVRASAFEVPIVDTTGAGDAFCAALAVRLAQGAALADALRFANAAGAIACTRPGAEPSMPHWHEVEALLANGVMRA